MGFDAVQISPPMEHIQGPQWWTRYQPVSYKFTSRSGDETKMKSMIQRCKSAGVKIYADAVINHMAAGSGTGTAGTAYGNRAVPGLYSQNDFHHDQSSPGSNCQVNNYQDQNNVQSCDLVGLPDLCTGCDYVQKTLGAYLTSLHDMGVEGFRVDASKHQRADELGGVLAKGPSGKFTFHEVISGANEAVYPQMYFGIGHVTEFNFARQLSPKIKNQGQVSDLANFGTGSGLIESDKAVTFIDNHDTQRGEAQLTYKDGVLYDLANVFMLAHPYGAPKVMSSYAFNDHDQGPPSSSVHQGSNLNCGNGQWVCEHRHSLIAPMVGFRRMAGSEPMSYWMTGNNNNGLAFGRGSRAFVAINIGDNSWGTTVKTGMRAGSYCDVVNSANSLAHMETKVMLAHMKLGNCSHMVNVNGDGTAQLNVPAKGAVAFHL